MIWYNGGSKLPTQHNLVIETLRMLTSIFVIECGNCGKFASQLLTFPKQV